MHHSTKILINNRIKNLSGKMLLLGFLLIPLVLAAETELKINDFIVKIENGTLKSVEETKESSTHLDLSNLRIDELEPNVFDNVINIKSLDLSNNSIFKLPQFVFANLTKLKKLSLRNNQIQYGLEFVFSNLGNLKSLDVSNNLLRSLNRGYFFGLDRSCSIFVQGNPIIRMELDILDKPSGRYIIKPNPNETFIDDSRAKVCIENGTVKLVDVLIKKEVLDQGCFTVVIVEHRRNVWYSERRLNLRNLNITEVARGWFRPQDWFVHKIDLSFNNINRISSELLNDIPELVDDIILTNNKIERLEKGVMRVQYPFSLDLSNNLIREIEDDAFANTKFPVLKLNGNRLQDVKFVATLPKSVRHLNLSKNEISELGDGIFSKNLYYLESLDLSYNKIKELRSESLRGLTFLRNLTMTNNGLKKIEPGSFKDFLFVDYLDLSYNELSSFEKGVFAGFSKLDILDLGWNKLKKVSKEWLLDFPNTLRTLKLHNNEIEYLQAGTFKHVPRETLLMDGNKISKIEKGTFAISTLDYLTFSNNSLTHFDVDSWDGLPALFYLSVASNNLTSIDVPCTKNLGRLDGLDLSGNPIKKFENGAFRGLSKNAIIILENSHVETIHAGYFTGA